MWRRDGWGRRLRRIFNAINIQFTNKFGDELRYWFDPTHGTGHFVDLPNRFLVELADVDRQLKSDTDCHGIALAP